LGLIEIRWKKVVAQRVPDIIDVHELEKGSVSLLQEDMNPESYVRALVGAEHWLDALKVVAHCLPSRELVWWACVCARYASATGDKADQAALTAAERWVYKPEDEHRREAFRLVQESKDPAAGCMAAMAAAFSEGTTPLADGEEIEREGNDLPDLALAALLISVNAGEDADFNGRCQVFLESADDIAAGGDGRTEAIKAG